MHTRILQKISGFMPKSEKLQPTSSSDPAGLRRRVVGVLPVSPAHRFGEPTTTIKYRSTTNSKKTDQEVIVGCCPTGLDWLHNTVRTRWFRWCLKNAASERRWNEEMFCCVRVRLQSRPGLDLDQIRTRSRSDQNKTWMRPEPDLTQVWFWSEPGLLLVCVVLVLTKDWIWSDPDRVLV